MSALRMCSKLSEPIDNGITEDKNATRLDEYGAIACVFEDIAKNLLRKVMNKHALYLGVARASKLFKKNGMIALYFLAEIEGPEQKSDSEAEKGLLMLLDSDLPALEMDFLELQKSK
ncbi:hypothetical protein AHAS_Ahas07G0154600 [Arachis hypogaea]